MDPALNWNNRSRFVIKQLIVSNVWSGCLTVSRVLFKDDRGMTLLSKLNLKLNKQMTAGVYCTVHGYSAKNTKQSKNKQLPVNQWHWNQTHDTSQLVNKLIALVENTRWRSSGWRWTSVANTFRRTATRYVAANTHCWQISARTLCSGTRSIRSTSLTEIQPCFLWYWTSIVTARYIFRTMCAVHPCGENWSSGEYR